MRQTITIYLLAWGGFYLAISQLWSSYKYRVWLQRIDATVDIDGEYLCIEGLTQKQSDELGKIINALSKRGGIFCRVIRKYRPGKLLK